LINPPPLPQSSSSMNNNKKNVLITELKTIFRMELETVLGERE